MDESNLPYISIIIPTYRRPERLTVCLKSIARLDYPQDRFEVIVVDDGGQTPLETLAIDFHDYFDLMLLKQAHSGPATARNSGAAQAKGEILAFTDDDCEPAVDWLQTLSKRYTATPGCAIGGRTLNKLPDNPFSTASQILIDYLYTYYNADPLQASFLASNNMALPSDRFHKIGGFDTTFPLAAGEDRELCDRLILNGCRLIYAKEAIVYHSHVLTFCTFWKQHFTYGRGALHFHRIRRSRSQPGIGLEPLTFYWNLLRYPALKVFNFRTLLLAMLLMVSQSANAFGYLVQYLKTNRRPIINRLHQN